MMPGILKQGVLNLPDFARGDWFGGAGFLYAKRQGVN